MDVAQEDIGIDHRFLKNQTVEVGDPAKGETKARRHAKYPVLISIQDPEERTMYDLYRKSAKEYRDLPYLGTRSFLADGKRGPYEWITYGEAEATWNHIGSGMKHLGLKRGDRVGIFSTNRAEWILTDAGLQCQSLVPVALYATLGANAVEYVINHAEITVVLCDGKNLDKSLSLTGCPQLKTVITFDPYNNEQMEKAKEHGVQLLNFKELEEIGKQNPAPHDPPAPSDLFTLMYTSGSTGNPKGVMLTQGNLIAEVAGLFHHDLRVKVKGEVHISYLPLAHSFERATSTLVTALGGSIGFFQGLLTELFNDIQELKPTFFCGAPRVFQRLHDKMWTRVNNEGFIKRTLFSWGVSSKMAAITAGGSTPIWDTILFSKTKASLGGRCRFILSGSAPLDPKLIDFLKACFCCPVIQGYGLTENCAGAAISHLDDPTIGHVGHPMACIEIKLVDVPEMNYFSTDKPCPRGEICLRGPNVFVGYYKDPEKTAEDLKPDGWFHTGDIGRWNPNGTLSIIDRKKNIFKLSQGEYVASEYLEGIFIRSPYVAQIFVYGDSLNSFLVAVVVPDFEVVSPMAKEMGIPNADDNVALCQNKKIEQIILKSMNEIGKEANLHGFEFPKAITLEPSQFSEDNNLLTPTFKLRRPNLKEHYQQTIAQMYEEYKKAHPDA
jgi:long-chain acyl-CoA synthetase